MADTNFGAFLILLLTSRRMFVLATMMGLLQQMSGTPYIRGGLSPAGTDCSGLASLVSNMATDRPVFGDRFNTGNEESALLARGFQYGTAPGALVIGWNGGHTAGTLPDGQPVSSGEGGGGRCSPPPVHPPHVSPSGSRCTAGCPTAAVRSGPGGRGGSRAARARPRSRRAGREPTTPAGGSRAGP